MRAADPGLPAAPTAVAAIIPAKDEADRIAATVTAVRALAHVEVVVVVDDGSTDDTAAVRFAERPSDNLFVAGEMMAGNVLGQGYTAGVGMSIGTAFGRIAGVNAARAAINKGAFHGLA